MERETDDEWSRGGEGISSRLHTWDGVGHEAWSPDSEIMTGWPELEPKSRVQNLTDWVTQTKHPHHSLKKRQISKLSISSVPQGRKPLLTPDGHRPQAVCSDSGPHRSLDHCVQLSTHLSNSYFFFRFQIKHQALMTGLVSPATCFIKACSFYYAVCVLSTRL